MGKVGYGLRSPGWRLDLRQPTRRERRLLARKPEKVPEADETQYRRFSKWLLNFLK